MTESEINKEAAKFFPPQRYPFGLAFSQDDVVAFAQHCVEKATGWRPIATVPKETEVLIGAFIDGKFKWGRSELFYEHANELEGETFSGWVWSIDYVSDSVAESPTHWQPLPPAPEAV